MHLFKILNSDTKWIVLFTKRIVHYKNVLGRLVSTLFEHIQYYV